VELLDILEQEALEDSEELKKSLAGGQSPQENAEK